MRVRNLENNINTNKLVYQKPEIELLDVSESIKAGPTIVDDGLGNGLDS
jgi:hypothetical protein